MLRSIRKNPLIGGAIVLVLLVAACATSPTGRKQLLLVPDDQVNEMGVAAFNEFKQKGTLDKDPAKLRYVRCISDAITATLAPPDDKGWEVAVFKDDTANAFALPGKKIGVHTGIMKVANTPDQLAAVIGHEIGHVMAKHSAERLSIQTVTATGSQLVGAVLATQGEGEQALIMGVMGLGLQYGVTLPYSRTHESEADYVGVVLMAQAGFDPRASVTLWQNMRAASQGSPPEFMSTHPSPDTRIDQLQSMMSTAIPVYQQAHDRGLRPNCQAPTL